MNVLQRIIDVAIHTGVAAMICSWAAVIIAVLVPVTPTSVATVAAGLVVVIASGLIIMASAAANAIIN